MTEDLLEVSEPEETEYVDPALEADSAPDDGLADSLADATPDASDSQPEDAPSAPEDAASDQEDAPTEPDDTPSDPEDEPSDPEDAPTEPEDAPSDPEDAASDQEDAPTEPEDTPSEPEGEPSDQEDAPSEPEDAPSDQEDAPSDQEDAPTEPEDTPSEPEGEPSDPEDTPSGEEDAQDDQSSPEEKARQLFASYLEPAEEKPQVAAQAVPEGEPAELEELEMSLLGLDDDEDEELAEDAEAEAEEEEAEGTSRWYVIHSYSGYEKKVKRNLEHRIESLGVQDKIFEVVVPTEEEIELKDGQRRTVERRIFPGYILVEMQMDEDSWYVVRNTPGVTGFVGSLRRPTPLRKRDVDRILRRMKSETPRVTVRFRPGEKVRICDGPFEDFVGAVDDIFPDKGKVRILVSFFGRETPVELDFLQVEKI
jgi:transcriptional antiterminator NusG